MEHGGHAAGTHLLGSLAVTTAITVMSELRGMTTLDHRESLDGGLLLGCS